MEQLKLEETKIWVKVRTAGGMMEWEAIEYRRGAFFDIANKDEEQKTDADPDVVSSV